MMCSLISVLDFRWPQEVKRFGLTGKGTEWWLARLGRGWACSPGDVGNHHPARHLLLWFMSVLLSSLSHPELSSGKT